MAIIMPPAPLPLRGAKWRLPYPAQVNRSGWTGRRKVVGLPGAAMWTLTAEFSTRVGQDRAKPWRGFFAALHGPVNAFPVIACEGQQTIAGNPAVRSGSGNATTVPLQGLPANQTVLVAGDFMTVSLPSGHKRLVCLTAPLVTNGQGQGTATFAPELGEIPAAGAAVEIQWPYGLMALTSDPPGWDVGVGQQYQFAITAEEAL